MQSFLNKLREDVLFRAGILYLTAALINASLPFFALPLIIRSMSPEDFGHVGVYLALVNVATILVGFGTNGIISVVHFRDGVNAVASYIIAELRLLVITTGIITLVSIVFIDSLELVTGLPRKWIWIAGLTAVWQFINSIGLAVFQSRSFPVRYASIQIGITSGWTIVSLILICVFEFGWVGRAIGQTISVSVVGGITLLHLLGLNSLNQNRKGVRLGELLRFGIPLLPHSLAGALMVSSDRVILSNLSSANSVGLYYAAFQICSIITLVAAAINQAWVPWLYKRLATALEKDKIEIVQKTYILYSLILIMAAFVTIFAPLIILKIAGEKYSAAIPIARWLAPAAAFSGMYYFVTNYLFYSNKTGVLSVITVGVAVLQTAMLFVIVPRMGIHGAAISTFIASFLYWLVTWCLAQKITPMPWGGAIIRGRKNEKQRG